MPWLVGCFDSKNVKARLEYTKPWPEFMCAVTLFMISSFLCLIYDRLIKWIGKKAQITVTHFIPQPYANVCMLDPDELHVGSWQIACLVSKTATWIRTARIRTAALLALLLLLKILKLACSFCFVMWFGAWRILWYFANSLRSASIFQHIFEKSTVCVEALWCFSSLDFRDAK